MGYQCSRYIRRDLPEGLPGLVSGVSVVTVPCDINDAGQIVGWYGAGDAKYYVPGGPVTPYHEHGFMLGANR